MPRMTRHGTAFHELTTVPAADHVQILVHLLQPVFVIFDHVLDEIKIGITS